MIEINQQFGSFSKVITDLLNQAHLARVWISICKYILSLTDVIARIKWNGLKGADSRINTAILFSALNLDSSSHHELNLSFIEPPSSRMQTMHSVVEIQDQNLYGSEYNIDCFNEGGNMRLIITPHSGIGEVWGQNLHDSKSNIDQILIENY